MAKKIKIPEEPTYTIKKVVTFKFAYEENAQRIAYAHIRSCHFAKVNYVNGNYIVEIYQ